MRTVPVTNIGNIFRMSRAVFILSRPESCTAAAYYANLGKPEGQKLVASPIRLNSSLPDALNAAMPNEASYRRESLKRVC